VVCVQAVIDTKEKGTAYETVDVEPGRPILADMDFGMADDYLYVLTEQNVSDGNLSKSHPVSKHTECILLVHSVQCNSPRAHLDAHEPDALSALCCSHYRPRA
jgi:hypothetical protein